MELSSGMQTTTKPKSVLTSNLFYLIWIVCDNEIKTLIVSTFNLFILSDHFLRQISSVFNSETMQTTLVQLQSIASDAQKTKYVFIIAIFVNCFIKPMIEFYYRYSDLLALAEELEPKPTSKRGAKNTKSKSKMTSLSNANNDSNTESDSSDVSHRRLSQRLRNIY